MSEYVRGWRARVAYGRNDLQCEILVYALYSSGGAVKENPDWSLIKDLPETEYVSSVRLSARTFALYNSLLKLADKEPYQARGILRSIIMMTYEGENQEMDSLPDDLSIDFSLERFTQFYYDTLLLKREAVRTYCRANEIRQVCAVNGLIWEGDSEPSSLLPANAPATELHPEPQTLPGAEAACQNEPPTLPPDLPEEQHTAEKPETAVMELLLLRHI